MSSSWRRHKPLGLFCPPTAPTCDFLVGSWKREKKAKTPISLGKTGFCFLLKTRTKRLLSLGKQLAELFTAANSYLRPPTAVLTNFLRSWRRS